MILFSGPPLYNSSTNQLFPLGGLLGFGSSEQQTLNESIQSLGAFS